METIDDFEQQMARRAELLDQIKLLQQEADGISARLKTRAAALVQSLMRTHGLSEQDLTTNTLSKRPKANPGFPNRTMPVRYRDAAGNSWSGIGRAPAWIADAPDRNVYRVSA